jgi:Domain of unknown function (DUF4124)
MFAALALLSCSGLAAQTFKCVDANGKVTYSGKQCSDLGLKDAGEVKDRLNLTPAYQPPKPASSVAPPPAPAVRGPNADAPPVAPEPDKPERRCFTIQTAKGPATRCNDVPPDDKPAE